MRRRATTCDYASNTVLKFDNLATVVIVTLTKGTASEGAHGLSNPVCDDARRRATTLPTQCSKLTLATVVIVTLTKRSEERRAHGLSNPVCDDVRRRATTLPTQCSNLTTWRQ